MAIKIFCDGSTRISNKKNTNNIGGYGYIVYNDNIIIDAFSEQRNNTTNNEMELTALVTVIEKYGTNDAWNCPTIYTDSQYAIKCLTVWGQKWAVNDWKKSDGQIIENLKLIQKGYNLLSDGKHCVNIEYCKGHNGIEGNELADKLATGTMAIKEIFSIVSK